MRIMVALVVRYPDGLERIQDALAAVIEAGAEGPYSAVMQDPPTPFPSSSRMM